MATAIARQDSGSRASKQKTRESREPADTPHDDEIPVLIRLPDLTAEMAGDQRPPRPPRGEQHSESAPARQSLWGASEAARATEDAESEPAEQEDAVAGSDATATDHVPEPSSPELESAAGVSTAEFRRLHLVGQLILAVLIVGLFAAAYFAIAGRRGGSSDDADTYRASAPDAAADEPAVEISQGVPLGVMRARQPKVDFRPAPAETTPPLLPAENTAKAPAAEPAPAAAPQQDSSPSAALKATEDESPEPRNSPPSPRDTAPDSRRPPSTRDWQLPGTPASAPQTGQSGLPTRHSATSSQPPLDSPPAAETARDNEIAQTPRSRYPATDPAKFRYPERYHEDVRISAAGRRPPDGSARPRESGEEDSGATTARMQQRMEPPPMR